MAIITISRGTFSGGKALAELLADRLGYPCVSREEIVLDAAREYGISEDELTSAMNEPPPFWMQVPSRRFAYLKCLTVALLERAKGGKLVYHGHAGHLLLSGISHLIRIRLIADMDYRIKVAAERMGMGRDETIAYIEKVDKERTKWARFLYGIDWQDAALYDAVFNLERVGIQGVCETVIRMTELDDFKVTPQSEKTFEDLLLSTKVWAALARDKRTRAASVRVVADDGKVTITGSVGSERTVDAIPVVAQQVEGVKEVKHDVGIGSDWYW